jgi:hypothetical protein
VGDLDVVEAHEHLEAEPFPFDAFRLQEYLRARGETCVSLDGLEHEAELFAIQAALDELVSKGVLRRDGRSHGSPVKEYTLVGRPRAFARGRPGAYRQPRGRTLSLYSPSTLPAGS